MHVDEYGQAVPGRSHEWCVKLNICKLWRRIWGPKESEIEAKLRQAKRDQAQFEAWFSKPTGGPK